MTSRPHPFRLYALATSAALAPVLLAPLALAQPAPDPASADAAADFVAQVVSALQAGTPPAVLSLLVGFLVAVGKQGWCTALVAKLMPARFRPAWTTVLAFAGAWVLKMKSGMPWQQAFVTAAAASVLPFLGHELIIEKWRKGAELVPKRVGALPPAAASAVLAMFLGASAVGLTGCIADAPVVPVTSANANQVSSCQSTAAAHNAAVVGGFALGGLTSGLSTVASIDSNPSDKTALAVSAAIAAVLTTVDVGLTSYTASVFTNGQCNSVVGALPAAAAGGGK